MKIIYDIETNGLVDTVDTIWLVVTKNIETNEIITFSDYDGDSKPLNELIPYLNKATVLIGHNIIINNDKNDITTQTKISRTVFCLKLEPTSTPNSV